jgi:hypothetical protein
MSGSRLVRLARIRLFLYLTVLVLVGMAVYVFHGAQLQLDDARKVADKCQQQQESLSAQLQGKYTFFHFIQNYSWPSACALFMLKKNYKIV